MKGVAHQIKEKLIFFESLTVLGPIPAPIQYINYEFRYRILIKTNQSFYVQKVLKNFNFKKILKNKVKIKIDIDPLSFF